MTKKILSIPIIILLCFGIIGCDSNNSISTKTDTNSNQTLVKTSTQNNIIGSTDQLDIKHLKNLTLDIKLTNLMIDDFKNQKEIKKIIVTKKSKKEDKNQKDIYVFVSVNKIDNINPTNIAEKIINLITNNQKSDFWSNHTGMVIFRNSENTNAKNFTVYNQYITKHGSNELVSIKNK